MAEKYPHSRILAMSHSQSQRRYIEAQIRARGIANLRVLTADINDFAPHGQTGNGQFDRIVSVEMFEHLRNYELLLARVASWLRSNGQCFVHIFCHRDWTYPFESRGASDWMAQHFFTGGLMPGSQLLQRFQQHLGVRQQWIWNGFHYQRTAEAWLKNLDAQRNEVLPILRSVYGTAAARRWFHRWRMFLLAVAELFGFNHGEQWLVSHYLLEHATHSRPTHTQGPGPQVAP
jgi:cyclopropane-fatty-acyl-phospholipid synthase